MRCFAAFLYFCIFTGVLGIETSVLGEKCPTISLHTCIDAFEFTKGLTYGSFKITGTCRFPLLLVYENAICKQVFYSFGWKGSGHCLKASLPGIDVGGFSFVPREFFFVRPNCTEE